MGLAMLGMMVISQFAWAKPERMLIQDPNRKARENTAKAQIKNVNLKNIEDPEARKAIREILNYLNVDAR